MRILYAGQSLNNPAGGGELSAKTLILELEKRNQVEVIGAAAGSSRGRLDGGIRFSDYAVTGSGMLSPIAAMRRESAFREHLLRHIGQFEPELITLQQPAHLRPSDLGPKTKLLIFVRSVMCFGIGDPSPSIAGKTLRAPFRKLRLLRNRPLLERADLIVTNSRFLQHELQVRAGLDSEVIHPFIDTSRFSARPSRPDATALTFVGLDQWKGVEIALALARRLKERPFLFLEGARPSAPELGRALELPNVTVLPWTDDMAGVMERSRILLMPSLWEEPFGRLPVEAGASGVPTIASDCGGLSESVGRGGILLKEFRNTEAWIKAIEQLDDPERYLRVSESARQNAEILNAVPMLSRFRDLIRQRLGIAV